MALLILTSNESVGVSSGTFTVVGTRDGKETVTVAPGAKVTLDASFNAGGDSITVSGNAGSYKAVSDGTQVILTDALGGTVTIPVGTTKSTVAFADASRDLVISGGALKLGNDTVGTTATTVTAGTGGTTPVVGQTFTLTTGANSIVGTAADDFIDGSLGGAGGSSATLNSFDTIIGGAGNDTLFASVTGSTTSPRISQVESLSFAASGTATIDLLNSSGYTSFENSGSSSGLTITNISSTDVNAKISNTTLPTALSWVASAVSGSSDSISLTLSNVSNSATGVDNTATFNSSAVTLASVETVSVVSSDGPNVTDFRNVGAATVKASGSQTLNLGALSSLTTTLDASQMTAAVTARLGAALTATVTGGTGNDSINVADVVGRWSVSGGAGADTIAGGVLRVGDVVDGGDGVDVVTTTSAGAMAYAASAPTTATMTNVEQLTITDEFNGVSASNATTTLTLANASSTINTINLGFTGTGGSRLVQGDNDTIRGPASAFTVNLGGAATGNVANLGGSLVIQATGTGSTDALTINNTGSTSSAGGTLNVFNGQSLTSTGYESVTVNTRSTATGSGAQTIGTLTITPDTVASPVSLSVSGANALSVTQVSTTSTSLVTVNASGMTAQATGTTTFTLGTTGGGLGIAGSATSSSVTGSSGADYFRGANIPSTIDGGAGADTIFGGTGNDSILGGDGADAITNGGGADTVLGGAGNDTITAGSGNESLSGGDGDDTLVMGSNLTASDTIDGGAGTNTLTVAASTTLAAAFANVSNIQQVGITGAATISLLAPLSTAGTTYDLSDTSAQSLTLATGYTGATTVLETNGTASNGSTNKDSVFNTANVALTVRGKAGDVTGMTIVGGTGTDALVVTADSNAADLANVSAVETITVLASTAGTATANLGNVQAATGTRVVVDASALTNVNATFAVSGASAQAGGLTVTGATTAPNTITLTNFLGSSSVTGGSGNDSITSGSGNDTLSGGAGNDIYVFAGTSTTGRLNASDVVTDTSGTADVLVGTVAGLTATTGALQVSGVETLNLTTASASIVSAASIVGASRINLGTGTSTATAELTNLAAGVAVGLGIPVATGVTTASGFNSTATLRLADFSGSSDALTVRLASGTSSAISGTLAVPAGIETVTLAASTTTGETENITLSVLGVVSPALVVSGGVAGQNLTLNGAALSTTTTSVNSTAYVGSLRVTGSASATSFSAIGSVGQSITGGSGNDTVTLTSVGTSSGGSVTHTLVGGGGADTLNLSMVSASSAPDLTVTSITDFRNINVTLANNTGLTISNPGSSSQAFNDSEVVGIVFSGGNSLSPLSLGASSTPIGSASNTKSIDASGVTGVVTITASPNVLSSGATVRGGAGATDVLNYTSAGSTSSTAVTSSTVPTGGTISGFESVVITTTNGTANADLGAQDFSNATGVSTYTLVGSNGYALFGLPANPTVSLGSVSTSGSATTFADGKTASINLATTAGTADTINVTLVPNGGSTGITLNAPGIETIALTQSSLTTQTAMAFALTDTNTNSVGVTLAGGKSTGTNSFTLVSGALQSNVTSFNASTFVGQLLMADTARAGAGAMAITGGTGNDTIIMRNNGDVLGGGSGTDTLKLSGNAVIGGYSIDLSSTTDQVVTFGGSSNTAVQTGFEYVNLSLVTGSYGADITGRTTLANQIVGTLNADNIVGGSDSDTITGGTGGDVIDGGSGPDLFVYTANGQTASSALSASSGEVSLTGVDRLSGVTKDDRIDLSAYASSVFPTSFTPVYTAVAGTSSSTLLGGTSGLVSFGRGNAIGTGVFSYSTTGSDFLFQFDSNGASSGGVETVLLVGAASGTSLLTGVIANTAGILTFV